jgi:hypothetical protein
MARRARWGIVETLAAITVVLLTGCSSPPSPPPGGATPASTAAPGSSPSPSTVASAVSGPVFAFENDALPPATWTFRDGGGTVLHTFATTALDGTFVPLSNNYNYVGTSTAILSRSNGITTNAKWSVIHPDGSVSPVASSLTPLLNRISGSNFPGNFLVDPSTLFAIEQLHNTQNPFKFYELDLATGATLSAASLVPLKSSGTVLFEPENIDPEAHVLSFLIANTTFDNVKISALSVATLEYQTDTLTVHPLASQVAHDILPGVGETPQYTTSAFVSGDGFLLIYQSSDAATTSILNLASGKTVAVASPLKPTFIIGQESVYFSPTNQYAALIGVGASRSSAFFIVDTATGAVRADIAALFHGDHSLTPMDWAGPIQLIFTTDQTIFANSEITHVYDLATGKVTTFPSGIGPFIGVLP